MRLVPVATLPTFPTTDMGITAVAPRNQRSASPNSRPDTRSVPVTALPIS
ncbi:MAG: hypothetical protein RR651_06270 [Lysinibacillus sp.]